GDRYVVQSNDGILSVDGKEVEKFASDEYVYSDGPAPSLEDSGVYTDEGKTFLRLAFDRPVQKVNTDGTTTLIKVDDRDLDIDFAGDVQFTNNGKAGNYVYDLE